MPFGSFLNAEISRWGVLHTPFSLSIERFRAYAIRPCIIRNFFRLCQVSMSAIMLISFANADNLKSTDQHVELEKIIESRKLELENIQNQLKEKQDNVKSLEKAEKEYLQKLYAIENQLNLNNRLIGKINIQSNDISKLINEMSIQLAINQDDLKRRKEILDDRLVWIYKRSRFSSLTTALSAQDPLQAARRLYMFSLLNRYDRHMVARIESLTVQVEKEKTRLESRKQELVALKLEKEQQAQQISQSRAERKELLKQVRKEKDADLKAIEQLDADQNRITEILDNLFESRKILDTEAAAAFENLKGKLLWPVHGEVVRKFGKIIDKKYNTSVNNPGIDIKAESGTPVVASSTGEVAYVSWLRGYGSFVILDHGGGYYSLYAHLDEISVETGQFIAAGETLGTVGETGSFSGPMLHFELRYGKEQVDPSPWLR